MRSAMATNSSMVVPKMLAMTVTPRARSLGSFSRAERLDADVGEPDGVEHARGRLADAVRRVADQRASG